MKKKILSLLVAASFVVTAFSTPIKVHAQGKERVTFGVDLTDAQEQQMLNEFGVNANQVNIDRITNQDIVDQLNLTPGDDFYKTGCYSSSYVKLTSEGGITVKSNNLTEVTALMLSNALITSGVENADVVASSPFEVTGTSALAGILKGVEGIQGKELSLKNKETAQKEIETTSDLAESIEGELDDPNASKDIASQIINDVKTEIIKDSPSNKTEIGQIVQNVTNNYNINISQDQVNNITNLMVDVNDLNINYDAVKDSLNNVGNQISDALKQAGVDLKNSGFFSGIWDGICDFFSGIWDWFTGLFDGDTTEEEGQPVEDGQPADDTNTSGDTNTDENVPTDNSGNEEPAVDDTSEDTNSENTSDNTPSQEDTSVEEGTTQE